MLTFPLRTERLVLEPLEHRDRDAFVAYRRDPAVARWQSWDVDWSAADADALIAAQPAAVASGSGEWLQLAVRTVSDGSLAGDVAVHAHADQPDTYELGVTLAAATQGRGIATEALAAVVAGLFQVGAHRLLAVTDARNTPAARVFRGLGFRHEGRAVDADWFKGEWSSLDTWALLRLEALGGDR
ncbi:GNAT family N-acetyltransferase [Luteimicrobium subarcticum]|uniref:RimJ/RimL family protein N-acetyltransferase n=1 Tax=Luteimicrobium subarcticum TaxID=620910 RepID=A0A2M8WR77_9MICO|nr:GNAT family protein [Luteimicrobium subarcticum]PJI93429.1 RimJ/RimL family protein N-acetyltransferase [Luteimicrobium subarcticum]